MKYTARRTGCKQSVLTIYRR